MPNGASLDGNEAKQLGSLSWDAGIGQRIRKRPGTLSLWRQLLSSVRELYPCKEDFSAPRQVEHLECTWCLRELALLEIIFSDNERFPNNPDSVHCTQNMWSCAKSLGVLAWKEGEEEVGILVWQTQHMKKLSPPYYGPTSHPWKGWRENFWNSREEIKEGHQKF